MLRRKEIFLRTEKKHTDFDMNRKILRYGVLGYKSFSRFNKKFSMILPERFEYQTKMLLMKEMAKHSKAVVSIIRVGIVELLQYLEFFQTLLVPDKEFKPGV